MPQGVDSHPSGKQDRVSEPRLQCPVDERDGIRNDDLSAGVHVPRHPAAADVHEVRDANTKTHLTSFSVD